MSLTNGYISGMKWLPRSDVKVLLRLCTFPLLARFFDFTQREGLGEAQTLGKSSSPPVL